ncbi:ATP-binding protein [Loktanella sp. M215]|uniref:ATP-binding protein n=1 Tax=Loktanella sp. M215 TaxID=2675431 RepID=UPI001F39A36D|nr:adenylate/guanylate cyclase domain-containing protein [Loktanella sp. M215]
MTPVSATAEPSERQLELSLLFTDIEGSTRLLQRLGPAYDAALTLHNTVIRKVLKTHGGTEVSTAGDSFFAVFSDPGRALAATVAAQKALARQDWPGDMPLRVRMGLHLGEVRYSPEQGYRGLDVHRAARISAAGHGGQVLISASLLSAIGPDGLPNGVSAADLGLHYLKDLRYPEHLYMLTIDGLEDIAASIKTNRNSPNNLPTSNNLPIGRDDEMAVLHHLFSKDATRLVTLTGPGGAGKTMLALETAHGLLDHFPSGVFFVPLAPIQDPAMVPIAIAQAMGVREFPGMPLDRSLRAALTQGPTLLVLDNMEHVIEAAGTVGNLLADCPDLKILVTSLEPLNIRHEQLYDVGLLPSPPVDASIGADAALSYPAVRLFVERAAAARKGFALTAENLQSVLSICNQLDGLPLAIELAASRIRLMTPQMIDHRLEQSIDVLAGGRRDEEGRHRTLRDTIAWSYDLLDPPEQQALAALSVFGGGFTVDSAVAVCADHNVGADTFDLIVSLLNRSLLREDEVSGETRLRMLETVRSFVTDELESGHHADTLRARHAAHYRDMVVALADDLVGAAQRAAVTRLHDEMANLRAALRWATQQPTADLTADLLRGLLWFWIPQGLYSEGRTWIEAALTQAKTQPDGRAKAIIHDVAGWFRIFSGDYEGALESCEMAHALYADHGQAHEHGRAKATYGITLAASGQFPAGPEMIMASLEAAKANADDEGVAIALVALGEGARYGGDVATAESCYHEALTILERLGNTWWPGGILQNLAHFRLREGRWEDAVTLLNRTYALAGTNGYHILVLLYLMGMGGVGVVRGEHAQAARLLGATRALLERAGAAFEPSDEAEFQRYEAEVAQVLGDASSALVREGAGLTQAEAVVIARRLAAVS